MDIKLLYGLKHKTYKGNDFNRMKRTIDPDFLKKNFSDKRKINRIERVLLGKEDKLKHKMKSRSDRSLDRVEKVGASSAMVRVGKRF